MTFIDQRGRERGCSAELGERIIDVAWREDIGLEGTCEGAMACSTCLIHLAPEDFENRPAPPIEEDELIDLSPDASATSRLGCQIRLTKDDDGLRVYLPHAWSKEKGS
ncbi:MAG: 2Fe-2S iron-sulfur cluster-binding protein [Pseudomonadota bacterium]